MAWAPRAGSSWSAVWSTTSCTPTASVSVVARCIRWYSTVARPGPRAVSAAGSLFRWSVARPMRTLMPEGSGYSSNDSQVPGGRSTRNSCGVRLITAAR